MRTNFCHPNTNLTSHTHALGSLESLVAGYAPRFFRPVSSEPVTEQQGDMAFHDASARFGGRRGCVEGFDLYARMHGLPLTSLVVRTNRAPLSQAAGNEFTQTKTG
jgi:hypothetical protein